MKPMSLARSRRYGSGIDSNSSSSRRSSRCSAHSAFKPCSRMFASACCEEGRVLEEQKLGIEDRADQARALHAAADLLELAARLAESGAQARNLAVGLLVADAVLGNHDALST